MVHSGESKYYVHRIHHRHVQKVATVNYPNEHDFTRITEQKHLTGQISMRTTLVKEFPQSYEATKNEPYYPIPREENRELYRKYQQEAQKLESVYFAGRLADYKYYNMDQVVGRALSLFEGRHLAPCKGKIC